MWVDNFYQLLESDNQQDWETAYSLKASNLPAAIYKYRGPDDLRSLENGTAWLAAAGSFNDPYDSSLCVDFGPLLTEQLGPLLVEGFSSQLSGEEEQAVLRSDNPVETLTSMLLGRQNDLTAEEVTALTAAIPVLAERLSHDQSWGLSAINHIGVKACSFSTELRSLVMWAHYTEYHRGFCLEYSVASLSDGQRRLLFPVRYLQARFDATDALSRAYASGAPRPSDANMPFLAASLKSPEWSYEHEWRFILADETDSPGRTVAMPKPAAIYIGARMPRDRRGAILDLARSKSIACCEMRLAHNTFALEPRPIPPSPAAVR